MPDQDIATRVAELELRVASVANQVPSSTEEWAKLRQTAEAAVTAAEAAQHRADDEASRANHAKLQCEDHSKETARLRGQVDAELNAITGIRKNCEDAERATNQIRSAGGEASQQIQISREALVAASSWVAQNMPQIDANGKAISAIKASSETISARLHQLESELEATATEGGRDRTKIADLLTETTNAHTMSQQNALAIERVKNTAVASEAVATTSVGEIKDIIERLNKAETAYIDYNKKLATLLSANEALNVKAEQLLPHAASAGLASAFREQKARFKTPQLWWVATFVASLVLLFCLAIPDFGRDLFGGSMRPAGDLSWDSILRQIVHRFPLILPLTWLAIYAGRNYSMAVRMEEDYAYKEAVSTAFEGYRREMGTIDTADPKLEKPLYALCSGVLAVLYQRPGRIYEGQHQDVTPLTPVINVAQSIRGAPIPTELEPSA
jgi:hypothetical protein